MCVRSGPRTYRHTQQRSMFNSILTTRALTFQNLCQVHELIGIRNNVVEVPGGSSSSNSKGFFLQNIYFFFTEYMI